MCVTLGVPVCFRLTVLPFMNEEFSEYLKIVTSFTIFEKLPKSEIA
jgi:hypothetical protein